MTSIVISSGHSRFVSGAVGILNEVTEARRVVPRVAQHLRSAGATVSEFHDDVSRTQSANLGAIVAYHNRQTRDLDVSVHFNAFQRTEGPRGTEVLHRSNQAVAARVSRAMAQAAGFINRGAKTRTDLSFLNRANRPAILLEVCFVDSGADAALYNRHFEDICRAIAESILDRAVTPSPSPEPPLRPTIRQGDRGDAVKELQSLLDGLAQDGVFGPRTAEAVRLFQRESGLREDGVVGVNTWNALLAEDSNDATT